jgi:hypothetical protein
MLQFFRTSKQEREAMGRRGRSFYLEHMSLEVGAQKLEALLEQANSEVTAG